MKKQKNHLMAAACLTTLLVAATACTNDELNTVMPHTKGNFTISAGMEQEADTRLSYDDQSDKMQITWKVGDKFALFTGSAAQTPSEFTATTISAANAHNASFDAPTGFEKPASGTKLYAIYPSPTSDIESIPTAVPLSLQGQNGLITSDMKAHYMCATADADGMEHLKLTFAHKVSIVKLAMMFPTGDGVNSLSNVALKAEGLHTTATMDLTAGGTLSYEDSGLGDVATASGTEFTAQGGAATVYLCLFPEALTNVQIKALSTDGRRYEASPQDITLVAGNMYTATVNMTEETVPSSMEFTVNVSGSNLAFNIPFPTTGTTPASITVKWGDGTTSEIPEGTSLAANDQFTHTYSTAGDYKITIESSVTTAGRKQIPMLNFYSNRTTASNVMKLKSLDTPLLNTMETDFSQCFQGCDNLVSISAGLFDNNTEITNFSSTFQMCRALLEIPDGLFAKLTAATEFTATFQSCAMLKMNPKTFIETDVDKATRFTGVSQIYFRSSFQSVGSWRTGDFGTPPDLWNYTYASGVPPIMTSCFQGSKVADQVPKEWGGTFTN